MPTGFPKKSRRKRMIFPGNSWTIWSRNMSNTCEPGRVVGMEVSIPMIEPRTELESPHRLHLQPYPP
jgi:hypothetical protein